MKILNTDSQSINIWLKNQTSVQRILLSKVAVQGFTCHDKKPHQIEPDEVAESLDKKKILID